MDFGWTEEQRLWRRAVRDFAQSEITPRVREIDTTERIPDDIIKGMAEMGLLRGVRRRRERLDTGRHRRRGTGPRRHQPGRPGALPGGSGVGLHLLSIRLP